MIDLTKKPFYLRADDIQWVNETLKKMTVDEKIAQLFCLVAYSSDEEYLDYLSKVLKVGGIMCRVMPTDEVIKTVSHLQRSSQIPMLISANLEAGGCGVSTDGTRFGCEMAVAATGEYENAGKLGYICGKEGAALGVNWAFAPIADIDIHFRNPITNTRTFGSDPDTVRKCAIEYIKAVQSFGVAAAIKHFPGDGVDERDQHLVSSVNDMSVDEWDNTYGKIYGQAIDEGVKTVMVGHIMLPDYSKKINPSLSDEEILPASLSHEIVSGLLRGRLGFNGLVVTDSTTMAGFAISMDRRRAVPTAIAAGCDMFLFTKNLEEDFHYMKAGVEDGTITSSRLDEAVTRILALKASLGLHKKENTPDIANAKRIVGCAEHKALASKCADQSITLVKNNENILPVTPSKYRRVLFYCIESDAGQMGYGVDTGANARLMKKLSDVGFEVTKFVPKPGFEGMMASSEEIKNSYDLIIYSANMATKSNQTVVRIEWCQPMGANVPTYITSVPTIFISLENPYHLLDVPRVKTYINTYGSTDEILDALVKKLVGKSEFKGKSPVDAFCGKWDTHL